MFNKRRIPIIIKAIAEDIWSTFSGTYLFRIEPRRTPNREEQTSAREEPKKTEVFDGDCEASSMVANCVLSPISAKNTTKKVEKNIFIIKFSFRYL